MSSVPVTCPHCYKSLHPAKVGGDGVVRCDACGHAFPASGSYAPGAAPPAYKPLPSYPLPQASPVAAIPGGKYQPVYPPASGPQNPGNPGLVACGIIVGLGVMGLLCCGSLAVVVYGLADQPLANQNVNPANPANPVNPPVVNPQQFNPPIAPQPFPQIPPPVFPDALGNPSDPFEPVLPPRIGVPGTPAPTPKSLNDFVQAMGTIDAMNFTARQLLDEFNTLPVEEGRRTEVVDALLQLLSRAGVHAGGLMAGPGQTALENWTSEDQATKVAEFAAGDTNHFARRPLLNVLAKVGGDAETAKALLPLLKDPGMMFTLPDVFAKIGPEAEDPLLEQLEKSDQLTRRTLYESLGKIGGAKSKEKLQALVKGGAGLDRIFGGRALSEIERRETAKQ